MPQISVIVPVYKVEKYIHRCVDSILGQTFRDFELILVDDGSPDNCGAICDEYAQKDSRIHVIHQANGGLSAARNAGIDWAFANSNSQWLTFIDSDDWVHPEYLERLLNAALENHVAVSVCGYVTTEGEEPDIADAEMTPQIWAPEDFYVEHNVNAIIACAKLYRKDCFKTIRYPVGRIHEDEFTTYRILFAEDMLCAISAPLYFYYVNQEGIMKSRWSLRRLDAIDAFEERAGFFQENLYYAALEKSVKAILFTISRLMTELKGSADLYVQNVDSYRFMKRKLRSYLSQYGRRFDIRIENCCFAFEAAYPGGMRLYWYALAVLRKLGIKRGK